ncbi:unnamed protein product [Cylicocyclus nassatus]|uniref:Uncharacterized protein n=1 Tax=Cylicocyclus nassatus TaxID=53992 RepID=A0AA36DLY1_CYLNA|nr:unnamed protein product [Cylicocyclus nassatus]
MLSTHLLGHCVLYACLGQPCPNLSSDFISSFRSFTVNADQNRKVRNLLPPSDYLIICFCFLLNLHISDTALSIMSTTKNSFFSHFFPLAKQDQRSQEVAPITHNQDLTSSSLSSTMDKLNTGTSQTVNERGPNWGNRDHLLRLAFVFDTNNY